MHPALMTGKIVETMRHDHTTGQAGDIMITRCACLLAVSLAIPVERSQACLLLGIHAQDRVASLEKRLHEMGQMAKRRIALRRVAAGPYLAHLAPGNTEPIEHPSHDAGSDTDGVVLQALGHLLGCHIRPHHVLAHGVARGAVFDRVVHLLDQVHVCDFRLCASASGLADATSRRIIGEWRELPHAVCDGVRIASKDLRDGAGAAMPQCDRFEGGTASAVLF